MSNIIVIGKYLKPIVGYEGYYSITEYGEVVSLSVKWKPRAKVLKQSFDEDGYPQVSLSKNNKPITKKIHRLVAICYVKNPKNYTQINHVDGDKNNNYYKNLEWCTNSMNTIHAYKTGLLKAYGEYNGKSKLTEDQVRAILQSKDGYKVLAQKYGVSVSAIYGIRKRTHWSHIQL